MNNLKKLRQDGLIKIRNDKYIIDTQKLIDENFKLKLEIASKDDQYQKLMNEYELVMQENQDMTKTLYDVCMLADDYRERNNIAK